MSLATANQLQRVWNQRSTPVLLNRGKRGPPRLRLPYREYNRAWLRSDRRTDPTWHKDGKYREVPRAWFNDLVRRCVEEFGSVYIIQPFRAQQKCAPVCWEAVGEDCECSCMGANHGMGRPKGRWIVLSETFAASWDSEMWACRHLGPHGMISDIE